MLFPLLILSVFLAIYSLGVSPAVFGGDSGDIVLSYYFAGVAHPPGYPLNTVLGWLLTRLPVGETFAYRANFVSAIYSSLAISILFLALVRLIGDKLLALAAVSALGFIHLYWLYAHNAEVFQLSLVLVSASLLFLVLSIDQKAGSKKLKFYVLLTFFFLGLAVFHHYTNGLLVPGFVYLLVKKRIIPFGKWRQNAYALLAFLSGFLPYIFVPFAALRKTPVNWDDPSNLDGFLRLITRADYGIFVAGPDLAGFSLPARFLQVFWYFKVIAADFTYAGIFLLILGIYYLFIKKKDFLIFLLICVFLSGPFFLFYASFPLTDSFLLGVSERFLLVNYLFLSILFAFGILSAAGYLLGFLKGRFLRKESLELLVKFSFFLFPLALFSLNFQKADLSRAFEGQIISRDILASADPPGIIFLRGDTISLGTLYEYYVNGQNRQSVPILSGRLRHASYRRDLAKRFPKLNYPRSFLDGGQLAHSQAILGLIAENESLPIYAVEPFPLDPNVYSWIQEGALLRLYTADNLQNEQVAQTVLKKASVLSLDAPDTKSRYMNFYTEDILESYQGIYLRIAAELTKRSKFTKAEDFLAKAGEIEAQSIAVLNGYADLALARQECKGAKGYFEKVLQTGESGSAYIGYLGLEKTYRDCFRDTQKADEFAAKAEAEKVEEESTFSQF